MAIKKGVNHSNNKERCSAVLVRLMELILNQEIVLDYSVINFTKSIVLFSKMLQIWRNFPL